jgi:hypothetical protein
VGEKIMTNSGRIILDVAALAGKPIIRNARLSFDSSVAS